MRRTASAPEPDAATRLTQLHEPAFRLRVSRRGFALWWLGFALIHTTAAVFFVLSGFVYQRLPQTFLGLNLSGYSLTMELKYYPLIAVCHYTVAVGHGWVLLHMIRYSLGRGHLVFHHAPNRQRKRERRADSRSKSTIAPSSLVGDMGATVMRHGRHAWRELFGYRGIFGVGGRYFEVVYMLREMLETTLQSYQAYRMSWFVSRVALNRVYVSVLVVNCLATPVLQHTSWSTVAVQRLLCLVLDLALDFLSTVIIPFVLAAPYARVYDPETTDFEGMLWYDNHFIMQTFNESRLVLVSSWTDLFSKLFFSLGMLTTIEHMKALIVRRDQGLVSPSKNGNSDRSGRSAGTVDALPSIGPRVSSVFPLRLLQRLSRAISPSTAPTPVVVAAQTSAQSWRRDILRRSSTLVVPVVRAGHRRRLAVLARVALFGWGVGVLTLHLRAERRGDPAVCSLHVRPWTSDKPGCSLLEYNCKSIPGAEGSDAELSATLDAVDVAALALLVTRHCRAVRMPSLLTRYDQLVGLKIYNSTVERWDETAELTQRAHPNLRFAFFVRVNFSAAELPAGLLSRSFPSKLIDVEFSFTNLHGLPDDLHERWVQPMVLSLEDSPVTEYPRVMNRMRLLVAALVGTRITHVDAALFTNSDIMSLHLSRSPVIEVPEDVPLPASTQIGSIKLWRTHISSLPEWISHPTQGYLARGGVIKAGGSPFCDQFNSAKANGTAIASGGNATWTWLLAPGNEDVAERVLCDPPGFHDDVYYPVDVEEYD
ncbi:hypothetical protein P43SY_005251 [Pythium insidiosum]|uniref:Transmembrane protein n=1 Tax=Pythium insidiosum TaxID=114742 RepID=A0AAD5LSF8_PYTIN|nr:hypothetical protein P43SY_005251 [Pythium insidiosum]